MKRIAAQLAFLLVTYLALTGTGFAAQQATGTVQLWSASTTPGFSLISVGGSGDGSGGGSLLCAVDATSTFGSTVMASAATAGVQQAQVTLKCTDSSQVSGLQLLQSSSD